MSLILPVRVRRIKALPDLENIRIKKVIIVKYIYIYRTHAILLLLFMYLE